MIQTYVINVYLVGGDWNMKFSCPFYWDVHFIPSDFDMFFGPITEDDPSQNPCGKRGSMFSLVVYHKTVDVFRIPDFKNESSRSVLVL